MNCQNSSSDLLICQTPMTAQQQLNSLNSLQFSAAKIDELAKSQFKTREGTYRRLSYAEYPQPVRPLYPTGACSTANVPVQANQCITPLRCSICQLEPIGPELMCFNVGRDLFVYEFEGVHRSVDLHKPILRRPHKNDLPTCHAFNQYSATPDSCWLAVGFLSGHIQMVDVLQKELFRSYNEEKQVDRSKVTCVRWVPHSRDLILVSHASGQLYQYSRDLPGDTRSPSYQLLRSGDGFNIYCNKTKGASNPMYRWSIGEGACIHEIAFSPCGSYLATVAQDGFLRVFDFNSLELIGRCRSYFGGLLCVCWSPDSRLVATGGEDDLITIWSLDERRVLAKGRGHRSWVSIVAFDSYTCTTEDKSHQPEDEEGAFCNGRDQHPVGDKDKDKNGFANETDEMSTSEATEATEMNSSVEHSATSFYSYRLGSVGQDTNLCLWEISDEVLRRPGARSRTSMIQSLANSSNAVSGMCNGHSLGANVSTLSPPSISQSSSSSTTAQSSAHSTLNNGRSAAKKEHRRNFSLVGRSTDKHTLNKGHTSRLIDDPVKLLGTPVCPRLNEVPHLEPLVCKKIAHERLSALVFRPDCFVTGCYEGVVSTWARPGKWSPSTSVTDNPSELADELDISVV